MKLAAALVLVAFAAGCKKTPKPSAPACRDDVSHDAMLAMQERVRAGADPCPNLATPRLLLDARGVILDDVLLVPSIDLPVKDVENIKPLFQALAGRRRLWRQLHPGGVFAPLVDLHADTGASAVEGASVLRSAAWAGFDRFHLVSGDAAVVFDYATPRPPGAPPLAGVFHLKPTGTFHAAVTAVATELAAHPNERTISFD